MEFGKRIDKPGGCRRAVREDILIRTALMTMTDSLNVDLLDLSKSGARLRGAHLPSTGQEVLLLVARLEAFGTIIWRDGDECGVHFDFALSNSALATLEGERSQIALSGRDAYTKLAVGDWENGLAR